ncbi:hypothetical protein BH23CHL8_BH23CHL8_18920 [soil metagenome]
MLAESAMRRSNTGGLLLLVLVFALVLAGAAVFLTSGGAR